MQPTFLKAAIRVLGSLIGLFGVSMLGFGVFLFLPSFITSGGAFGIAFAVFGVLLGVYFTRVGYLVWFRWSPLAVRHVVGTLAFLLLGQLTRLINPRPTSPSDWSVFWPLAGFLAIYLLYQFIVARCLRLLFPVPIPATNPPPRST